MDFFEMPVKCGKLKCTACTDPNYPGVDVEFVPEGATDNNYSPRVLVEWPKGDNDNIQTTPIRTLIWFNDKEDYSFKEDLVFGNFTPHSWTPDEEPFLKVPLSVPARGGQIVLIPIEMRFLSGVFIGFIKHGASVPDNPFKDKSTPGVYVGTRRDDFRGPWNGIRTCITACTLNSKGLTRWCSLWYSDFGPYEDEPVVPLDFHERTLSLEVNKRFQMEKALTKCQRILSRIIDNLPCEVGSPIFALASAPKNAFGSELQCDWAREHSCNGCKFKSFTGCKRPCIYNDVDGTWNSIVVREFQLEDVVCLSNSVFTTAESAEHALKKKVVENWEKFYGNHPDLFCMKLEAEGWERFAGKRKDIAVYQRTNKSEFAQLTVPLKNTLGDYELAWKEAFNTYLETDWNY